MKILLICAVLCMSACSYRYTAEQAQRFAQVIEISPQVKLSRYRQITLSPMDKACVSLVTVDDEPFQQALAKNLSSSLQQRFTDVFNLPVVENQSSSMNSARNQRCDLLVYPTILERADKIWSVVEWDTEIESWSDVGMDQLQLQIAVWDVNNGQLMDMAVVTSRSPWLQISKNHSEDLLAVSINEYVKQLVAVQ